MDPLVGRPAPRGATVKERESSGFALLVAVVALLLVTAIGHAAFFLSRQLGAAARSEVALVRARLAAEGGVDAVAARWPSADARTLAAGTARGAARGTLGGVPYSVVLRRIGAELFLLEGTARTGTGVGAGAGRLFWSPDPGARLEALPAAVGGTSVFIGAGAAVDGWTVRYPPPAWAGLVCDTLAPLMDSLFPGGAAAGAARAPSGSIVVSSGGTLAGLPPGTVGASAPDPALGLLDVRTLGALADVVVGGRVTPGPAESGGRCVAGATNWGSPRNPAAPCGSSFPVVRAPGALEVDGGAGQGIVVGEGDLDFRGGAEFLGVALAAGSVRIREGSVVRGFVVSGGSVTVEGGGRVEAAACPALRALGEGSLAGRVFPVPDGSWIGR